MITRNIQRLSGYARAAVAGWHVRTSATEDERRLAKRHLAERLGQLRGLPGKVGQLLKLSTESDGAADDDTSVAPTPIGLDVIRAELEAQWQRPLDAVLRHLSPQAHPASLGQVHRATLLDGREVAIKVQYPGMRDALRMDLNLLGWLSLPAPSQQRGFDLSGYQAAILDDMEHELDYRQEAASQRRFRAWAAAKSFLVVPELIDELCTANVLVARWEDGATLDEVREFWSASERQQVGDALSRLFHEGLFERAMLHADWHPGNFRFRRDSQGVKVLLYDFGCVYESKAAESAALLRLIRATRDESESPYPLLLALGFRADYLKPIEQKLPALCKVLLAPYVAPYPYDLDDWKLAERFHDILREDRWNFRVAGPPALIFLVRAFHGLMTFVRACNVTVSWRNMVQPMLERRAGELDQLELPAAATPSTDFATLARLLKIRVQDGATIKVQLTYPAATIDHLHDLMDEHVRGLIARRGIDLEQLVAQARHRAYAAGSVFAVQEGTRTIQVWLE